MFQHYDRGLLLCKKIHTRYNYVAEHCHYEVNWKNDFKAHKRASHGRVKHPCDASQYKASSNFTLNEREKNPCVERKYKARSTFTCDYCQFSANSARFLQIHKENSHNKREVNVHGGADYDKVLNECGKSRLKLENKSLLSKHIQSKP